MAHSVTRDELFGQLADQIGFLERSGRAFDEGDESEAKRLATSIRILVHDTATSRSLLGLLNLRDRLRWIDTGERINPRNLMPTNGLVMVKVDVSGTKAVVRYVPRLDKLHPGIERRPTSFQTWWTTKLIKDGRGNLFSRRDLTLAVANKDGGAHVDPSLKDDYVALSRANSLGFTSFADGERAGVSLGGSGQPALGNPALAAVRQVSFEVERTLGQIRWLVDDGERAMVGGPRARIDREAGCACGSRRQADECCLANAGKAFDLGNLYGERDEPDLAIDAWRRSVDLGETRAPLNLGLFLMDQGDFEGAEEAFRIGADRGDPAAASNLGCLLLDRDRSEAIAAFERGVELGSPAATNNLAKVLLEDGERPRALQLFLDGAGSGDAESAFFAGNLRREGGQLDEAMLLYGEARAGGHAEGTFNHGKMLLEAGRLQEAKVAMEEAVALDNPVVADAANAALRQLGPVDSPG